MANQVFKSGNIIGTDKVRVHRGGNRIDGVSKDNELFYNDLPVPKRSKINLSFDRKLSFRMGELIPILAQECVPGDTFHIAQAHNVMFAPLISPVYQRIDYRTYYFFVPTRLVDDGFKDFITMKNPDYIIPHTTGQAITNFDDGPTERLCDFFDLPVQQSGFGGNALPICTHPFRMYELIWNEYFRDEFKQTEITIPKDNNSGNPESFLTPYKIRNIGWEKDYFTTCQTEPQLGADVPIPHNTFVVQADGSLILQDSSGSEPTSGSIIATTSYTLGRTTPTVDSNKSQSYKSGLKIGSTTIATINDLRIANHLQELRDKLKIAGARYNEAILAEYGVVVPDYRIQRPEYIGGFASPVNIGRVMQTTPTTGESGSPLGSYAGSAAGSGRMDYIHYNCLEHGYIIGVSCVIPRTSYDQGIPRHFIKRNYFDYYHPDLATLGDQEVLDSEIFVKGNGETKANASRFGYQQRYAEYKYAQDRINSEFRDSLSFWHMSREFQSVPALNGSFVESNPTDRIFAVQDGGDNIFAEIYQQIDSVRPMPVSVQPNLSNVE